MKNWISLGWILALYSCQTIKIDNTTYQTNEAKKAELGVIGHSKNFLLDKEFKSKAYPVLASKIKVNVSIVPFTKKSNKVYLSKIKKNQNVTKINYIDSLPIKPELISISLSDNIGYCHEINSTENAEIKRFIKDTKKAKVITALAIVIKEEDLQKIKNADEFYLMNKKDQKYTLGLFKQGKHVDIIDISTSTIIGYEESSFCWSEIKPRKWEIIDLVTNCESCKGNTVKNVTTKKKAKSLYRM